MKRPYCNNITFVTFFTDKETWTEIPHPYAGIKKPHNEFLPYFFTSIKKQYPTCQVILLTNLTAKVSLPFDKVIRTDINQDEIMFFRLKLQRTFLKSLISKPQYNYILFLDTDILLVKKLEFNENLKFDIGVTVRDNPKYEFEKKCLIIMG